MSRVVRKNKVMKLIDGIICDFEVEILKEVADNFIEIDNKSVDEIYKDLLEYERTGSTGCDCGWSWLLIHDADIQKDLKKQNDNLEKGKGNEYVALFPKKLDSHSHSTFGLEVILPNYPLSVQSTKIKAKLLRIIAQHLEIFNVKASVQTLLD